MDTCLSSIPSLGRRPPTPPISCSAARERLRDDLVLVLEYDVAGMARLDHVDPDAVAIDQAGELSGLPDVLTS
jgi:hypothetical protein